MDTSYYKRTVVPLILIANTDAIYCEQTLIRSLLHRALNDDTRRTKNVIKSKKYKSFKNTKTKLKQKHNTPSHTPAQQHTTHTQTQNTHTHTHKHHPQHHFTPKLFRKTTDNFFYMRLDKLFEDNLDTTFTVHVTNGKIHTHINNITRCWGTSTTTHDNMTYPFSQLALIIFKHDFVGDFEITPERTLTRDRQIFQIIYTAAQNKTTTSLIDILPHITPQDWFALYSNTTKIKNNRPLFYTVRRFIRNHAHTHLHITTQQLNAGISANLTLSYHPNTNMRVVKQCHRLLIQTLHSQNTKLKHCLQDDLYTTFRKPASLGERLLNYRSICKGFDPSTPAKYNTPHLCSNNNHYLHMPYELPDDQAILLRNIDTPITASPRDHINDITTSLINIAHKLCTPFQTTTNPLTELITFDTTSDNTFFNMQHETVKINNFTLNNLVTVFEHNADITDTLLFLTALTVTLHVDKPITLHDNFLFFLANKMHVTHDVLSHPIHRRKHIRTFSSGTHDRDDGPHHKLFGSIGNPWKLVWDVKCMLLTPTPADTYSTLQWLHRSIDCTGHNITALLIIPQHNQHLHTILTAKYHKHSCLLPTHITDSPHTLHIFSSHDTTATDNFFHTIKRFLMHNFGFRSLSDLIPKPNTQPSTCSLSFLSPELQELWSNSSSCNDLCRSAENDLTRSLFTQPRFIARLPFHKFRLNFYLSVYNIEDTHRRQLLLLLENTVDHKTRHNTTTDTLRKVQLQHPDACFIKIDHNARQCGICCPHRYHSELEKAFLLDKRHFKIIEPNTILNGYTITDNVEESVIDYTRSRLNPEWLPHTWKSKPKGISYLYLTVKEDGVRFRPIGSSSPLPHARLLSLVSMCLNTILKHCGIKHYTLWHTLSMKERIHEIDTKAKKKDLFIFNALYDVKSFFTDIQKTPLLFRVRFFAERFCKHNHTKYISVPKYGKPPKPKPGKDHSGKFYFFHVDMILDIIEMALDTAFFKLGIIILIQILGLVMGDPLSPPLAQIFIAYDEYHHQLLNHTSNTNLVHTFIFRYMDDISAIALARTRDALFANRFFETLQNSYEHDLPTKFLSLVKSKNGTKLLDSDLIVSDQNRSIKLIYHNKNASIVTTELQTVGRYLQRNANAPHLQKLSALVNTFVRIPRTTSLDVDMYPGIRQVLYEGLFLDYTIIDLISALSLTNRIEPSTIWTSIIRHLEDFQKTPS
jgi:hypothetical protein